MCKYCQPNSPHTLLVEGGVDHSVEVVIDSRTQTLEISLRSSGALMELLEIPFTYCPMCGRNLNWKKVISEREKLNAAMKEKGS